MTTPLPTRTLYVTGTDTGIGKTVASVALLHRLRSAGLRAIGMKPVASGCERTPDGWRNDDALRLQAASDPQPAYDDINPYALALPTAPQLAARAMSMHVDLLRLGDAYLRLAVQADAVVIEGVGGWAAPLDDGLDQVDLVRMLDVPVVMVVGLRLGCLSHARLTARAIQNDGVPLLGWIGSRVDPMFSECDDYIELLSDALSAPCLGVLPYTPNTDPAHMSKYLTMPA